MAAGRRGWPPPLRATHFGLDYLVLEQGSLVDAIRRFPLNMVFFTPELLEIGGIPLTTPYEKPTRQEALRYYRKVVDTFQLHVSLYDEVVNIEALQPEPAAPGARADLPRRSVCTRAGLPRRSVRAKAGSRSNRGTSVVCRAFGKRATWFSPWGITRCRICSTFLAKTCRTSRTSTPRRIRTPPARGDRRRQELGGGSGAGDPPRRRLRDDGSSRAGLWRIGQMVKPDIENRVKEGSIAARFNARVVEIRPTEVVLDTGVTIPAEDVLLLTGYRADDGFMPSWASRSIRRRSRRATTSTPTRRGARTVRRRRTTGGQADRHRVH